MRNHRLKWLAARGVVLILAVAAVPPAGAYVLSGQRWPDGETIVMELSLGASNISLIDGSSTWNNVAEAALAVWNPYLGSDVRLVGKETTAAPAKDDRINQVFFDTTVYGEDFGDDTLAITLSSFDPDTKIKVETDIVVNSAKPFNSYRGALEKTAGDHTLFDLRRVLIHEFGHVLGLNHVAQNTASIMTPVTSNIETIQPDDIAGVQAIYGKPATLPVISVALDKGGAVGMAFQYQITASGSPTSFGAEGLPDGLGIDTSSGLISGTPTTAGTSRVTITASNSFGTDTKTLVLTFAVAPLITSPLNVTAYLNQPFIYRLTTSGAPTGFVISYLPSGLSFDRTTGLVLGTPAEVGYFSPEVVVSNIAGADRKTLNIQVRYDHAAVTIHEFGEGEGRDPVAPLVQMADGSLYGTTKYGGLGNSGTVYKLGTDAVLGTLYSFSPPLGTLPMAGLLPAADGGLFGTTSDGGTDSAGSVYELSPGGVFSTVHEFRSTEGCVPTTGLIRASDGNLYGTTAETNIVTAGGTIFKITPDGTLTTMHTLVFNEGFTPSMLVQGRDGNLYGTTQSGGTGIGDGGTIFRMTLDGKFTVIHSFEMAVGSNPTALIQASDGNLYGSLEYSGANAPGVIYRMTPAGAVNIVHVFVAGEGAGPSALCQGTDGNFYGTTHLGGYGNPGIGTIFKVTPDGVLTTVHAFVLADGVPMASLIQGAADGEFYGTTADGGVLGYGTIFKTTLNAPPVVLPAVSLAATTPRVMVGSGGAGAFTVSLSAPQTVPVIVYYTVKGSAINGTDCVLLKGKKKIKPGKMSRSINVIPRGDLDGEAKKVVKIVLQPDPNYTVGTPLPAKVKIFGK